MPSPPERTRQVPGAEQRCLTLPGIEIAYRLRRSRRRTIGLTVDRHGLTVGAPLAARIGEIEAVLRRHAGWIGDKLAARAARQQPPSFVVGDGARLLLLGQQVDLVLTAGNNRFAWTDAADGPVRLHLALRPGACAGTLLERALRDRARTHFSARLAFFAPLLGLAVPPLMLSSARTRWGSCNVRGEIRLNWRLIHASPAVLDYVVVHELAHCHEMNHGPAFWAHVACILPAWRALRQQLRLEAATFPLIEKRGETR